MTAFEKLREDAQRLKGEKLRSRAEQDIGLVFPDDWDDEQIRSAVADWFKSFDHYVSLKSKRLSEIPQYMTGIKK